MQMEHQRALVILYRAHIFCSKGLGFDAISITFPFVFYLSVPRSEWVPGVKLGVKCAEEMNWPPSLTIPGRRWAPLSNDCCEHGTPLNVFLKKDLQCIKSCADT